MSFLKQLFDERFILHRLKATRFATIVMVLAMAAYFYYELLVTRVTRYDLLVFLVILAVGKIGATVYYRLTN